MVSLRSPQLSKSRYMAGLQCLKRLYLETYRRELADPVDPGQQARFDAGTAVGELARQRFPGGKLVAEEYYQHEQAVRTTRRLLRSVPVPPIYEAAFSFEGIRTRVDVLHKSGGPGFDMVEVKSSTGVSPVYIPDVAIQMHVLEGAGVPVDRAWLMHVNNAYVYEGGPLRSGAAVLSGGRHRAGPCVCRRQYWGRPGPDVGSHAPGLGAGHRDRTPL